MVEFITQILQSASMGPWALPLAFLLGVVSAVASACCTLPAMGMLVSYSGTRNESSPKTAFVSTMAFMIGTVLALIILGVVAGFLGQAAQVLFGKYWKVFAGVVAVVLGLAALKLLPMIKLPELVKKPEIQSTKSGILGTVAVGLLMGGGVAATSLPCNPGIFIVIGTSILMGHILWGMLLMAAFGVGFSIPLGAILFGVALGKASIKAQKAEVAIRVVAGVLLVCVGFYLLGTF